MRRHSNLIRVGLAIALFGISVSPALAGLDAQTTKTLVTVATADGDIVVELFADAGSTSIKKWLRLVQGPIFDADITSADAGVTGYYTGLAFNYTRPHIEVMTAARPPEDLIQIEIELNAESLGLHEQKIESRGEATDLVQMELYPALTRLRQAATPQLREWLAEYQRTENAEFLVGVSRKEINEAIGYSYTTDVRSRPFIRGCVALKPLSPTTASARLAFALTDRPERTGRWMVIGQVVKGFELVEQMAVKPLKGKGTILTKMYEPLRPVSIESVKVAAEVSTSDFHSDNPVDLD